MNLKGHQRAVPEPTLRRLPVYHHMLRQCLDGGMETVSCSQIADELHYDPTQIRKDLAVTGIKGRPKVGYDLAELVEAVETFLGWNSTRKAFLAGAGHLGSALVGYGRFNRYGLEIVAAFDRDPARIGKRVHDREVLPITKLPNLARRMHVLIGIITVPAPAAQEVADLMVQGGIRAIWNFAPIRIEAPDGVIVQNEDLYATLGVLLQRLNTTLREG
ncbi:MAG TPA: redox-sensing transcriptional repressor Rex [Candidatus Hydrogenedentes bacterium]|nr:redox-sensing transcriptional repressor Rex [Candidatus Hydrogenedentota bacterium]